VGGGERGYENRLTDTDTKIRVLSLWGRGQCMFIFKKTLQLAYKKNNYRTKKIKLVKQKTTTLKPQQKVVSSFLFCCCVKLVDKII